MVVTYPSLTYSSHSDNNLCQSIAASFMLLPSRRVRILIPKNNLSPAAIQNYFAEQQFVMPFDFELPEDLLRHLGIDYYRIHTGVYKIQEDKEYIMVDV